MTPAAPYLRIALAVDAVVAWTAIVVEFVAGVVVVSCRAATT
jgi:hypothetical protein